MPFRNPARFNAKSRVESFTVHETLTEARPATAANYQHCFWIAPAKCVVDSVEAEWRVAGGSGATVTVHKVPSGTAVDSGTGLHTAIATSGTAATTTAGVLSATAATLELAAGDRLQLVDAGTLTNLADLNVTVGLHWIS